MRSGPPSPPQMGALILAFPEIPHFHFSTCPSTFLNTYFMCPTPSFPLQRFILECVLEVTADWSDGLTTQGIPRIDTTRSQHNVEGQLLLQHPRVIVLLTLLGLLTLRTMQVQASVLSPKPAYPRGAWSWLHVGALKIPLCFTGLRAMPFHDMYALRVSALLDTQ